MDVVALTTSPVQAAVHRLNWNRLCVVAATNNNNNNNNNKEGGASEPSRITALAWHPSGRGCVVVRESGVFDMVHVDQGNVLSMSAPVRRDRRVLGLEYAHQIRCEPDVVYVDRADQHFPKLSRLRKSLDHVVESALTNAAPLIGSAKLFRLFDGQPRVVPYLVLVCLLTDDHHVSLLANDSMMPFARTDVLRELRAELLGERGDDDVARIVVRQSTIASDLSSIVSVVGGFGVLHLTCCHGSRLWAHRGELALLARQRSELTGLLSELYSTLAAMRANWKAALQPLNQKLSVLRSMLESAGSHVPLELEFEALVTTGRPSPTLHQYMAQQLGEQMVKRIHGALKQSLNALQLTVSSFAPQLVDQVMFRLDDMRANAAWTERFAPLGVHASLFEPMLAQASELAHALSDTSIGLAIIARRYDAFWNFFCERVVAAHASGEEAQTGAVGDEQVLAYVKLDLLHDNVSHLLDGAEAPPPPAPWSAGASLADTSTAVAIRTWQEFLQRFSPQPGAAQTYAAALRRLTDSLPKILVDVLPESEAARFDQWSTLPLCHERAARQPYSLSFTLPEGYSCAFDFAARERKLDEPIVTAAPASAADIEHASQVSCGLAIACVTLPTPGATQRSIVLMQMPSPVDSEVSEAQVCAFHFEARHVTSLSYSQPTNTVVVLFDGGSGGAQGQLSTFDVSSLSFQPFEGELAGAGPLAERVLAALDDVPLLEPTATRHLHRGKAKLTALSVNHERSLAAVQIGKRRISLMILEGGDDADAADGADGAAENEEAVDED